MSKIFDVIVIGSGPSGAHVAEPLVKANLNVVMIDGGISDTQHLEDSFKGDFEHIRKTALDQYKLFLGRDLSGIPLPGKSVHSDMMTKGPRQYISQFTKELLPVKGSAITVAQSLAKGGLSETWGASCDVFNDGELKAIGIPPSSMHRHYQEVIDKIGVSGISSQYRLQPPSRLDNHGRALLSRYLSKKHSMKERFELKRPLLAVLTLPLGKRKAVAYDDVEYLMNRGDAIYRSRFTIEELEKKKNFTYKPFHLVDKIETVKDTLRVHVRLFKEGRFKKKIIRGKYLAMSAGSVNTVRILLASLGLYHRPVPFMIKRHILMPCIHLSSLGKAGDTKRLSLCQLFIKDKSLSRGIGSSFTQLYSYKSLMLFKLLDHSPLPTPEALSVLSFFTPATVIADVRFPSFLEAKTTLSLNKDQTLQVESTEEHITATHLVSLARLKWFLISLGLIPIKRMDTPLGSTAHYAGGIPFSEAPRAPLSASVSGKLHQHPRIFIADASTWNALPPKPPALTIMANANRIAYEIIKELKAYPSKK